MENFFDELSMLIKFRKDELLSLPKSIKDDTYDIALRLNEKPSLYLKNGGFFTLQSDIVSKNEIEETVFSLCDYSVYKHMEEIKNGFISAKNKFRVGVCGTGVMGAFGKLENIRDITSLIFRIPRTVFGAASEFEKHNLVPERGILIVGEPSSGKTTILKDLIRIYKNKRLVVLDERFELTNNREYFGVDTLCGYPKSIGFAQAIRNLGAKIILCDELDISDFISIENAMSCGVGLVASVHGDTGKNLRPLIKELVKTGAFSNIVVLKGRESPTKIHKIYTVGEFDEIYGSSANTAVGGACRVLKVSGI